MCQGRFNQWVLERLLFGKVGDYGLHANYGSSSLEYFMVQKYDLKIFKMRNEQLRGSDLAQFRVHP